MLCVHGDPTNFYPRTPRPHRRGRGGGSLRHSEKRWRQLHGAVPLSWREIALFFCQPHQAVFPLLWLRQKRQCHWFFDGPRRHELCRSRQRLGPKRGHASARRRPNAPRPRACRAGRRSRPWRWRIRGGCSSPRSRPGLPGGSSVSPGCGRSCAGPPPVARSAVFAGPD